MKKLIQYALIGTLLFTTVGCANNTTPTSTNENIQDVLTAAWKAYDGEEFTAVGGDVNTPVENAPGIIDLSNKEAAASTLIMSTEDIDQIESASTLMHAMNQNTFTSIAVQLKEGTNAKDFAANWEASLTSHRWMCGFPEKYVFLTYGNANVICIFGQETLVDAFQEDVMGVEPAAKVVAESIF